MRKYHVILSLNLLVILFVVGFAWGADIPKQSASAQVPRPAAPISAPFGPCGEGFPVGRAATILNYLHSESDGVRLGGNEINDNIENSKNMYTIKLRYGIAPGWDIRSTTPLYEIETKNKITNQTTNKRGIGDTPIALHRVLFDQSKGDPLYIAFDWAIVLPTAHVDSSSLDAIGNRAWGIGAGLGLTWYFAGSSQRLDQELSYISFAEGARNFEKPDSFRANTSYAYAINEYVDIGVESLFEYNPPSHTNGISNQDRKHEWYAGPKVMFKHKGLGMFLGFLATFPIDRDYDKASPSDGYRFEFKLIKGFNLL